MQTHVHTNALQNSARILLGIFMVGAAIGHFSFARADFQAQVPNWVPMNKDTVVLLSGIPEMLLGLALIFWTKQKVYIGIILAIFYVLVFPGNLAQYTNHYDAFGLNTDQKRLTRLFFQPVLILWALWSTGALKALMKK
ncbi:DoxX family protein [Cytophaga aurantiaca]|uniref:DoxX family protein n=1 Tax=Cytophaga aurantiaca TaxID=29530 RepID=UPI000378BAC9|nr:membrane protein [Cytophaga aurantiaca]